MRTPCISPMCIIVNESVRDEVCNDKNKFVIKQQIYFGLIHRLCIGNGYKWKQPKTKSVYLLMFYDRPNCGIDAMSKHFVSQTSGEKMRKLTEFVVQHYECHLMANISFYIWSLDDSARPQAQLISRSYYGTDGLNYWKLLHTLKVSKSFHWSENFSKISN